MALLSRRTFLRQVSVAALAVPLGVTVAGRATAAPQLVGVDVRPRVAWAAGLAMATFPQERPGDVRFLLVHHSASSNAYAASDVPRVIRGFHALHTGPGKGWPDVAYNFFVDRYGGVWEGRAGSLAGPVLPDATGGSQGFAQICCFIGDHTVEPPTSDAQRSMTALLAALAERYRVDPTPGATTTFVSRGSNKWPAGTSVTTATIAGHRDMSLTSCPGGAAYPLVTDVFPAAVTALLAARSTPTSASATRAAPTSPTVPPTSTARATSARRSTEADATPPEDDGPDSTTVGLIAGGGLVAGVAAYFGFSRARQPHEGRAE